MKFKVFEAVKKQERIVSLRLVQGTECIRLCVVNDAGTPTIANGTLLVIYNDGTGALSCSVDPNLGIQTDINGRWRLRP